MATGIEAVVFKTPQLEATRIFFETVLQLPIKEKSVQHFVVHSKGIRLVFVESAGVFETALYLNKATNEPEPADFETCKDPNGISIITFYKNQKHK